MVGRSRRGDGKRLPNGTQKQQTKAAGLERWRRVLAGGLRGAATMHCGHLCRGQAASAVVHAAETKRAEKLRPSGSLLFNQPQKTTGHTRAASGRDSPTRSTQQGRHRISSSR
eukprot:scaffold27425_cov69-Phaeocystis_antarctica.AAC.2